MDETISSVIADWSHLREMRKSGDVDGLIGELSNMRSEENARGTSITMREGAIIQLFKMRDQQAALPVAKLLNDPLPTVRSTAARALGAFEEPAVVPSLLVSLKDAEAEVRWNAARSLGDLRAQSAVNDLIKALGDESQWVRLAAAKSLGRIGDPTAATPLKVAGRTEGPLRRLRFLRARLALRRG